jgi:uncharacterized protein with HEPN domain
VQRIDVDPVRRHAVIRAIEIIGEATKNISGPLKEQHPETPWRLIAGSRDKLIHAYFEVDWRIVWNILKNEVPALERGVRAILPEFDAPAEEAE